MSITAYLYTNYSLGEISQELEKVIDKEEETLSSQDYESLEGIIKKWQKSERLLSILLKHNVGIEISSEVHFMRDCMSRGDEEDLWESCLNLHSKLIALKSSEKPTFSNVF